VGGGGGGGRRRRRRGNGRSAGRQRHRLLALRCISWLRSRALRPQEQVASSELTNAEWLPHKVRKSYYYS